MKTFLHLMRKEKFTGSVSAFYEAYFSKEGHEICYIRSEDEECLINQKLEIKQSEFILPAGDNRRFRIEVCARFLNLIRKYDYIVIHSMFLPFWLIWTVTRSRNILKKFIWIEWGYDLYNYQLKANNLKGRIVNKVKTKIREHCNTIVCIFPPDCDYYKQKFPKHSAKVAYAPYCGAKTPEEYLHYSNYSRLHQTNEENESVWIQVGHSATDQIDHIATLKTLEKFKNENIMILLPLSYGNVQKADLVQMYAEKAFPGKVFCLRDFMPASDYFNVLSRVDIAIFDTNRQIALGNIQRLAFRNTKIYLSENSVMYNYFIQNGVPIQPISAIENQSFEDFCKECLVTDEIHFRDYLDSLSNMQTKLKRWMDIYDGISGD